MGKIQIYIMSVERTIKIQNNLGAKSKSQPSLYISAGPGYLDKRNICSKWLLLLFSSADNATTSTRNWNKWKTSNGGREKLELKWGYLSCLCLALAGNGWRGASSRRRRRASQFLFFKGTKAEDFSTNVFEYVFLVIVAVVTVISTSFLFLLVLY